MLNSCCSNFLEAQIVSSSLPFELSLLWWSYMDLKGISWHNYRRMVIVGYTTCVQVLRFYYPFYCICGESLCWSAEVSVCRISYLLFCCRLHYTKMSGAVSWYASSCAASPSQDSWSDGCHTGSALSFSRHLHSFVMDHCSQALQNISDWGIYVWYVQYVHKS